MNQFLNESNDILLRFTRDGHLTWANKAFETHLGFKITDFDTSSPFTLVKPTCRYKILSAYRRLLKGATGPLTRTLRVRNRAGRHVWLEAKIFFDNDELAVIAKNVSEEKHLERLLIESQRIATVGSWKLDLSTRELWWSEETYRIFEKDPHETVFEEEALGHFPEDVQPKVIAAFRQVVDLREPFQLDIPMLTASGRQVWIRAKAEAIFEMDEALEIMGTIQDITRERRLVEEQQASLSQLETLTEMAPAGIFLANDKGETIYLNKSLRKAAPEGLELSDWKTVVADKDRLYVQKRWEQSIENQEAISIDFETRKGRNIRLDARPVYTSDEKVSGYVGVTHDITEQTQVSEQFQLAIQAARQASQSKSRFLANMSHEIRTPLNTIMGMADLIKETSLNQEQRRYVESILDSGDSLINIINDILDLSKIEAGQLEIETIEYNLPRLVSQIGDTMAVKSPSKDLELVINYDQSLPEFVKGDPLRTRQILLNLISNALKFTTKGEVRLDVRHQTSSVHDHLIVFTVQDTGIGIPPSKIKEIFMSFTQADTSITRQYGGSGLGLNITKKLTEAMHGSIDVQSEVGKGSRFIVTVPVEVSQSTVKPLRKKFEPLKDKRFLVLEPNRGSRELICKYLQHYAGTVEIAKDLSDARQRLDQSTDAPFEAVFVNADLPKIEKTFSKPLSWKSADGYVITTRLVLIFPKHHHENGRVAKKYRANTYLTKPFLPLQVLQSVTFRKWDGNLGRVMIVDPKPENYQDTIPYLEQRGIEVDVLPAPSLALDRLAQKKYLSIFVSGELEEITSLGFAEAVRSLTENASTPLLVATPSQQPETSALARDLKIEHIIPQNMEPSALAERMYISASTYLEATHRTKGKKVAPKNIRHGLRILLVDDSAKNRELVVLYMKDADVHIEQAENGLQALEKFKSDHFDIVLMDMQMPIMDGYTATRKIREWEASKKVLPTPVIALTAFALKEEKQKSFDSGCSSHLTKPIKKAQLLDALTSHLQEKAS